MTPQLDQNREAIRVSCGKEGLAVYDCVQQFVTEYNRSHEAQISLEVSEYPNTKICVALSEQDSSSLRSLVDRLEVQVPDMFKPEVGETVWKISPVFIQPGQLELIFTHGNLTTGEYVSGLGTEENSLDKRFSGFAAAEFDRAALDQHGSPHVPPGC